MPDSRSAGSEAAPRDGSRGMAWSSRLAALAQVAQVIAAAAVVVSLVYVGRELSNTTAAIRSSSMQAATVSASQSLLNVASDSSLSRIVQVGRQDPSRLTGPEEFRRETFMRQFWLIMQNVYLQNELGTIDPRAWKVFERIICDARSTPGGKASWSMHRQLMDGGFTTLVEACS
jgi:hypothetical protein